MPTRSSLSLVVATLLAILPTHGCRRTPPPPPPHDGPNILLITLDTTRVDRLGCYGYPGETTPHLDALADAGTRFELAICSAAVTPVSHASILTGLRPYTHGLRVLHGHAENRLPEANLTLAEVLKDAGYQTAAFISAFPAGSHFGLAQGFDTFDEDYPEAEKGNVDPAGNVNTGQSQRHAGDTTDSALAWLETRPRGRPFFLWLHYFDPHDPRLLPPPDYFNLYAPSADLSLEDQLRAIYDIEVRFMDHHIGRFLDALRERGLFDDTLIVVTADHGEGLGDHDWWTHGILYQEQIHAPLIIRGPGAPAGRVVSPLVRTIDILPTLCALADLPPRVVPSTGGVDLSPLLAPDVPPPALDAYADSVNMLTYRFAKGIEDKKNDMLFCIIEYPWKYIHHLKRPAESELYHLVDDPRELDNRFAAEPARVEKMRANLANRDYLPEMKAGVHNMSEEDIARLRSLGYVGDE
jgi:arylsulfatase A-like enzyme